MAFGPKAKTEAERDQRRCLVAELYIQCYTLREISERAGVTVTQIYRDLQWAHEQWRSRAADAIEKLKQTELSRLDWLELEATKAWQRSIGKHVIETVKTTRVDVTASEQEIEADLPADEITRKSERLAGDPRFLDVIADCIKQRRAILGLDAPVRQEIGLSNIESILARREAAQ